MEYGFMRTDVRRFRQTTCWCRSIFLAVPVSALTLMAAAHPDESAVAPLVTVGIGAPGGIAFEGGEAGVFRIRRDVTGGSLRLSLYEGGSDVSGRDQVILGVGVIE